MDFLINDLSIHGQYLTANAFFDAVETLMSIRRAIRREGREFYCHRGLKDAMVTPELTMAQAIQFMSPEKRRPWLQWITQEGPHWEDSRQHSPDEFLEDQDIPIYTDHAIGEAAYSILHDVDRGVVSADPSDWLRNPIPVTYRTNNNRTVIVNVVNHWSLDAMEATLKELPSPLSACNSWKSFEEHARRACDSMVFAEEAFEPMNGYPFVRCVGEQIFRLLDVLNKLNRGLDDAGNRTSEFETLYETYFNGHAPYFTSESDTNKAKYQSKMTFPDPEGIDPELFCPWHGKPNCPKNYPPIRIHFSWPKTRQRNVSVVYIGKKITTN